MTWKGLQMTKILRKADFWKDFNDKWTVGKCHLGVEGEGAIIKTPRVKENPAARFFIYTSRLKGAHLKCQKAIFTLLMKVNRVWCFASSLEADGTIIAMVSTRFMSVITLETCRLQLQLFFKSSEKISGGGGKWVSRRPQRFTPPVTAT